MNQIQVFNYHQNEVRTLNVNGQPWWVAKDICDVLEISKHRDAVSRLDPDERGSVVVDTLGGPQEMTAINEYGLYSIILQSRKPEAKVFKRWITHEVIPSIRNHGLYAKEELLDNPDLLLDIITKLKSERELRLEAENHCKVLIDVVEYKNEVIEGLVDSVDVYTKRTVLNRVVKHGGANFQQRYRELYRVYKETSGIDLRARCEGFNKGKALKKDHLSVIGYAEVFGFIDGLYKVAVRLYETDVNQILESIQRARQ